MTLSNFFQSRENKSRALFREFIWILSEKFNLDEAKLISGQIKLEATQQEILEEWERKKKEDYPLQYFIGNTEFLSRKFFVQPGVLIPRMETEEIVSWVIKNQGSRVNSILDIGAGSGCMGISLALEFVETKDLILIEPYEEACKSLNENIRTYCKGKRFTTEVRQEFFEDFQHAKKFDLIVSNPPYIAYEDKDVQKGVYAFEPHEALFGGEKGWEKYLDWVDKSFRLLNDNGKIVFEFSHDQKEVLKKLLNKYEPSFYGDSFGKDRFFVIGKKEDG